MSGAPGTRLREVYLFACAAERAAMAWFITRALLQSQAEYRWDLWVILGLNIASWYAVKGELEGEDAAPPEPEAQPRDEQVVR